jgi:hypothetical protein
MSNVNATVSVFNGTASTVSQLWAVHSTSSKFTSPDWICANTLPPGESRPNAGTVIIKESTDDYWCFTWSDTNGSCWSTGFYEFELKRDAGGEITVELQSNGKLEIDHGDQSNSHDYFQVGNCPRTS